MLDPSWTMRGCVWGKGKEGGWAFHAMSKPSMRCRSLPEFKSFMEFEVLLYLKVAYSLADFAERFFPPPIKMLNKFILFRVQGIASACPSSSHTTRPQHSVIKDEITLGFERAIRKESWWVGRFKCWCDGSRTCGRLNWIICAWCFENRDRASAPNVIALVSRTKFQFFFFFSKITPYSWLMQVAHLVLKCPGPRPMSSSEETEAVQIFYPSTSLRLHPHSRKEFQDHKIG